MNIPMSSPDLTDAERDAVAAVLRTPNLSMGSEIQKFEKAFQAYTGCRFAIGVSSGTAGLHLCVRAAGVEEGDLVITTPFSFVASTNVLLFERAIPIFVDVDPATGNIDPDQVNAAIYDLAHGSKSKKKWLPRKVTNSATMLKAIIPVDVFGQPADYDHFNEVAREHGLTIIEDSCESLGAEYKNLPAGTLGDYGVYAFYPNKQITTGEGAIIVTEDEQAATFMRALRNQGRAPGDTWLQHTHLGYNYRLDEMSAALGRVQLTRIEHLLSKRTQVAEWYTNRLREIPIVECPHLAHNTTRMSWFVYVIRIAEEINRDTVAKALGERGIPARPYFLPIHLQPYMVDRFGYRLGDYPITEDLGRRSLALPFSSLMTEGQVEYVCKALQNELK